MSEEQIYERYLPGYSKSMSFSEIQSLMEQVSVDVQYKINAELQQIHGEGDDRLSFENLFRSQNDPLQWPNLLALDVAYWSRQPWHVANTQLSSEQSSFEIGTTKDSEHAHDVPSDYLNLYCGERVRLFYRDRFVYGRLFSALHYVLIHAKLFADHWGQQRYPYQLPMETFIKTSREHGDTSSLTQKLINRKAYQSLREYFNQHYISWVSEHYLDWMIELNTSLNHQTAATYIIEYQNADGLPWVDFICKNEATLRNIRPSHFVEDIDHMRSSETYLEHEVQKMAAQIVDHCRTQGW